jgi:hypothetical protein
MHVYDDLMFLLVFFIQLCLVLIIWFVRTENNKFRGLKVYFLGLIASSILRFCWAIFFIFLERTLS